MLANFFMCESGNNNRISGLRSNVSAVTCTGEAGRIRVGLSSQGFLQWSAARPVARCRLSGCSSGKDDDRRPASPTPRVLVRVVVCPSQSRAAVFSVSPSLDKVRAGPIPIPRPSRPGGVRLG